MVNPWRHKRVEHLDAREKAQLRWYHFSMVGGLIMGRAAISRVMDSPSTTYEQKRIAQEMYKLSEELEQSLRNERINC